ncbi:DUF1471 domain-containing protein [Enterobacter hormaechei]|uniref:DUF1471 domain-containing protein n=1 Tax=Enterobacter ludwigii TaxID=299767 RepID=A0AAX3LJ33_9ENTR|nr:MULTISPECIES: DUF1471 domain-containing protein [Enterobacteriaceae]EKS6729939.1 DUF1471 domain-containing protein [Enterobacter mori]EES0030201.1 DUF1471 domain-containing protein [Escherichia coli]MBX8911119.1 DUF1471 domain-containing protein [Enterobacter ludwigii]MCD9354837.1 DUF1471 domain-containing protein [Klebsiella pneumoniae]MCD9375867.1 DUF1471 domain-containing protein [Klebsiella pneumoniae]
MKNIKLLAAASVLSVMSFSTFAQSVSVTASTLSEAEAKVAAIAQNEGASSYRITSANTNERVYMTAVLEK